MTRTRRRTIQRESYFLGYVLGFGAIVAFVTGGCLGCCCCFCGCGRKRAWMRLLRRSTIESIPFLDLVENQSLSCAFGPVVFLFGFALTSTLVLAGSALLGPGRVFPAAAGPVASLSLLCSDLLLAFVHSAVDARLEKPALSWVLVDRQWRTSLERPDDLCSAPLRPPGASGALSLSTVAAPASAAMVWWEASKASNASNASNVVALVNISSALPPLHFAVRDERAMGVPGVVVHASVAGFDGGGCDGGGVPQLTGSVSNVSSDAGVATLRLTLATDGCADGALQLRVSASDAQTEETQVDAAPPLPLLVSVHLFRWQPESASATQLDERSSAPEIVESADGASRISVQTSLLANASLGELSERLTRTSNISCLDGNGSSGLNGSGGFTLCAARTVLISEAAAPPLHMLAYSRRLPPVDVHVREPFNVSVTLLTSSGLPVPGEPVVALLLAPRGSRGRLVPGTRVAFTDANGTAAFSLAFERGLPSADLTNGSGYRVAFSTMGIMRALSSGAGVRAALLRVLRRSAAAIARGAAAGLVTSFLQAQLSSQREAQLDSSLAEAQREGALDAELCVAGDDGLAEQEACLREAEKSAAALATSEDASDAVPTATASPELQQLISTALQDSIVDDLERVVGPIADSFRSDGASELRAALARSFFRTLPLPEPLPVQLRNRARPRLLAPVFGYGLSVSSSSTVPYAGMSSCALAGYQRAVPSPAGRGVFPLLLPPTEIASLDEQVGVLLPIWQPWPFAFLNWALDTPARVADLAALSPPRCRESYISSQIAFPLPTDSSSDSPSAASVIQGPDPIVRSIPRLFGAFDAMGVTFSALNCTAGGRALDNSTWHEMATRSGWDGCHRTRLSDSSCPAIMGSTGAATPANGSVTASTGAAPPANGSVEPSCDGIEEVRHWAASPRVQDEGASTGSYMPYGEPLCEVVEEGPRDDDWTQLRLSYGCERRDGMFALTRLRVVGGGSSRELKLRLLLDGVQAIPSRESWWRFDGLLHYRTTDEISFSKLSVLFLVGHDAFSLFALLSIPVLVLNTVRRDGGVHPRLVRLVGVCSLLLFSYFQGGFVLRLLDQLDAPTHQALVAFGPNDVGPMPRFEGSWSNVAIVACLLVTFSLFGCFLYAATLLLWSGLKRRYPKRIANLNLLWLSRAPTWLLGGPRVLDGALEAPPLFESDMRRRRRAARNHVRLLLRGRGWFEGMLLPPQRSRWQSCLRCCCCLPAAQSALTPAWRAVQLAAGGEYLVRRTPFEWHAHAGAFPRLRALLRVAGSGTCEIVSGLLWRAAQCLTYTADRLGEARLLQTRVHRRTPLEGVESLFYPQRLYFACASIELIPQLVESLFHPQRLYFACALSSLWIGFLLVLVTLTHACT